MLQGGPEHGEQTGAEHPDQPQPCKESGGDRAGSSLDTAMDVEAATKHAVPPRKMTSFAGSNFAYAGTRTLVCDAMMTDTSLSATAA